MNSAETDAVFYDCVAAILLKHQQQTSRAAQQQRERCCGGFADFVVVFFCLRNHSRNSQLAEQIKSQRMQRTCAAVNISKFNQLANGFLFSSALPRI